MVKAGQADHTRDTQKHESESNSHDDVEVKAESAKHKRPENLITLWGKLRMLSIKRSGNLLRKQKKLSTLGHS